MFSKTLPSIAEVSTLPSVVAKGSCLAKGSNDGHVIKGSGECKSGSLWQSAPCLFGVHRSFKTGDKFAFFNCDSLHARLNSHYQAWSYKKKKRKKIRTHTKSVWKEKISVNSRLKANKIIGQRKACYRKRISECSYARKETVRNIDILAPSKNGQRKIMQSIRITSRPPSRKRKWNQLSKFWRASTKVMPIEKT